MRFFINSGAYTGIVHRLIERGHEVVGLVDGTRVDDSYICYAHFANPQVTMQQYSNTLKQQIVAAKPDVYICCKGYFFDKYVLPETTEWIKKQVRTTIYWCQDDPFFVPTFVQHQMYRGYDIALTCDLASVEVYKSLGIRNAHLWWPAWDHIGRIFTPVPENEKIDCVFAGSPYRISPIPRNQLVEALLAKGINVELYGNSIWTQGGRSGMQNGNPRFASSYKGNWANWATVHTLFARSRINFSNHIVRSPGYLNDRVFMIMGVGGFLLMDDQPEVNKYFIDGKEIVYFSTVKDFADKALYYLKNPELRNTIGENAQKKILAEHTYAHRVDYLLNVLEKSGVK